MFVGRDVWILARQHCRVRPDGSRYPTFRPTAGNATSHLPVLVLRFFYPDVLLMSHAHPPLLMHADTTRWCHSITIIHSQASVAIIIVFSLNLLLEVWAGCSGRADISLNRKMCCKLASTVKSYFNGIFTTACETVYMAPELTVTCTLRPIMKFQGHQGTRLPRVDQAPDESWLISAHSRSALPYVQCQLWNPLHAIKESCTI